MKHTRENLPRPTRVQGSPRRIGKTAASEAWIAEQEAAGHTVLRVGTMPAQTRRMPN